MVNGAYLFKACFLPMAFWTSGCSIASLIGNDDNLDTSETDGITKKLEKYK